MTMDNIKISVIMPVYKVEKYIAKAVESIQTQTLKEFEFLIVDDGSPDNSGKICDSYAEKDSRITVIHKENEGAPSARNRAMKIAKGKYLYFLDSDDWAEPTMLEDMYNLAEQTQAQLIITGFYIDTYYSAKKYMTSDYIPEEKIYTTKEEFRKNAYKLFDKNMLYTPWNKLYLAQYIKEKELFFPKTLWDDFPFNLSVISDIERVTVTSKQYYHFLRARSESETAKYIPQMYEKREEEHGWMLDLYKHWDIDDKESKEMIARRYLDRIFGCIENLSNRQSNLSRADSKKLLLNMLDNPRLKKCLKYAKGHSFYLKIMYFTLRIRNFYILILEAQLITFVKSNIPSVFCFLKAKR